MQWSRAMSGTPLFSARAGGSLTPVAPPPAARRSAYDAPCRARKLAARGSDPATPPKGTVMARYLFLATSSPEGKQGLIKDGGTRRASAIKRLVKDAAGRLESHQFACGEADACLIADLPDAATAAALSLNASASGAVDVRTVALMTPAEFDDACAKKVNYRPPGA